MKGRILEISDQLRNHKINELEAKDALLILFGVSNCLHEDNFPINRLGDSQCTDCGKVISHLDM